jgi:hypothetical protein
MKKPRRSVRRPAVITDLAAVRGGSWFSVEVHVPQITSGGVTHEDTWNSNR